MAAALALAALSACSVTSPLGSVKIDPIPLPVVRQDAPPPPPARAPAAAWERIGTSVRGKPLEATQFGSGPLRVYIVGGVRGDEPEGPAAAAALADMLAAEMEGMMGVGGSAAGDAAGVGAGDAVTDLLARATVRILRDVNPDGSSRGVPTNTRGVDLSRNWPSSCYREDPRHGRGPASEIETAAVVRDLASFNPDVVIVLSASVRGPRVQYAEVGKAAPAPNGKPVAGAVPPPPARPVNAALLRPSLVVSMAAAARRHDPRWRANPDPQTTPSGSLGALTAKDWRRPTIVLELQRGSEAGGNARGVIAGVTAIRP